MRFVFQSRTIFFQVHEKTFSTSRTRLPQVTPQTSSTPRETKSMEAATPELGPVVFWSPKSSTFRLLNFVATLKHAAMP